MSQGVVVEDAVIGVAPHVHLYYQTTDLLFLSVSPEYPMVPNDLPHKFLKRRIWAVKEPHPPTVWAEVMVAQNCWAVGWFAAVL